MAGFQLRSSVQLPNSGQPGNTGITGGMNLPQPQQAAPQQQQQTTSNKAAIDAAIASHPQGTWGASGRGNARAEVGPDGSWRIAVDEGSAVPSSAASAGPMAGLQAAGGAMGSPAPPSSAGAPPPPDPVTIDPGGQRDNYGQLSPAALAAQQATSAANAAGASSGGGVIAPSSSAGTAASSPAMSGLSGAMGPQLPGGLQPPANLDASSSLRQGLGTRIFPDMSSALAALGRRIY